ncbi:MAG: c-type cytochrome biogenesis protein CcmI [Pseudoruegeria sp.]
MVFWGVAAVLSLGVVALLVRAMMRGAVDNGAEHPDLAVYRDQLSSLEADVARGVLAPEEAERGRIEIQRRLLDADRKLSIQPDNTTAPRGLSLIVAGLVGVGMLSGAFWMYKQMGAPGYPDMPLKARISAAQNVRDNRPTQAAAEASLNLPTLQIDPTHIALVDKLRAAVADRPDDIQGHRLLAVNEGALGNYAAAHAAQTRVIELLGDSATSNEYSALADMMILAAGGYVSPEAEISLTEALRRDAKDGSARYYSGLMLLQTGRPDMGFAMWRDLLAESQSTDPWVQPIIAQIGDAAAQAGVDYTPPAFTTALPGPNAEDISNASEMDDEDRQAMIEGMVANLSDRLATEGGSPEEWARLIRAQGVLGQTEQAAAVWQNAQEVFESTPEALALIEEAAEQVGVAP